jgi:pimeloyl-ACP methyl ester carboxylesterase
LTPELDHLASEFRPIYYDQRGRGLLAVGVTPEDVTLASDLSDLDRVRERFNLETAVLLGRAKLLARFEATVSPLKVRMNR